MKFNFVTLAKKQGFPSTQSIHVETIKRLTLHIDADSSTKTPWHTHTHTTLPDQSGQIM